MPPKETLPFTETAPGYFYRGKYTIRHGIKIPHGDGEMEYRQHGARYIGTWVNGNFHGEGILHEPDQSMYIGSFQHSQKHGRGRQQTADGSIFIGEWVRDVMQYPVTQINNGTLRRITHAPEPIAAAASSAQTTTPFKLHHLQDPTQSMQKFFAAEEKIRDVISLLERNDREALAIVDSQIHTHLLLEEERNQIHAKQRKQFCSEEQIERRRLEERTKLEFTETITRNTLLKTQQGRFSFLSESRETSYSATIQAIHCRLVKNAADLIDQKNIAFHGLWDDFLNQRKTLLMSMEQSKTCAQHAQDIREFKESLRFDAIFNHPTRGSHGAVGEKIDVIESNHGATSIKPITH